MANGLPTKTPRHILERNEKYRRAHWEEVYARQLAWQRENKEKCNVANRKARAKLRAEVLNAYGNECECCYEIQEAFLEVHHVNGGGNAHRKELGGGARMYAWLKGHNWPKEFGLLCSNCNKAKYNRGVCPHELERIAYA